MYKYFNNGYKSVKAQLFNEIYGTKPKHCPYDVLTDEVRVFCSNLKSCFSNLANSNIKHFEMKKKLKMKTNYSLLIPSKSISNQYIFKTILGKIDGLNLMDLPTHDCRLFFNNKTNIYIYIH